MPATYKTPDVYVEEISVFPPSVAEVETAIPAFIGYTEKAKLVGDNDLLLKPTEIYSLKEFEVYYGGPRGEELSLTVTNDAASLTGLKVTGFTVNKVADDPLPSYLLYYAVKMFFDNGGGKCYIISVGPYQANPPANFPLNDFIQGLEQLALEDEPTMLVVPEAVKLTANDYIALVQKMLTQCGGPPPQGLKDRFAIFDIYGGQSRMTSNDASNNRGYFGNSYLSYGAAYYPFLKTNLNYFVDEDEMNVTLTYLNLDVKAATAAALPQNTYADGVLTANANGALPQIGGVALAAGDRVLVKDEAAKENRGIYSVTNVGGASAKWVFTRTDDVLKSGWRIRCTGDANKIFVLTTPDPIELEKSKLEFTESPTTVGTATTGPLPANTYDNANRTLTANANGPLQIGGVTPAATDRILVKNEAAKENNGIYSVTNAGGASAKWVLTRTDDVLSSGVLVRSTTAPNRIYALLSANPITVGASPLDFADLPIGLASLRMTNTAVYNFAKAALKDHYIKMPPSGAVAGVYAATDTGRGVWKAPANVSLADVIEPLVKLDNSQQDTLNVDATTGKSINALRSFAGKGTLVWGARTLDGNSNEWRFVPVRRFFIMVEESVKKSTYWAVFEPNDANTWVKVRGMIENYLTQKWREGALAGATPKDAFFVRCGLGTTMSAQDILEGRMNVEIGMAAVRPAEFIVLKFSHKMQTS